MINPFCLKTHVPLNHRFNFHDVSCGAIYQRGIENIITKTCLCNFDPLKPHFYVEKWGLQGYTLFFLFLLKTYCGYPLEPPHRGGSIEYPQSPFRANITKRSHFFHPKHFVFAAIKSAIILNGRVFVMVQMAVSR